jgi:hypothetical protein
MDYIEINTYEQTLDECVYTIKTALETKRHESAFKALWEKWEYAELTEC